MNIAVVASGLAYEAGAIPVRARLEAHQLVKRGHQVIGYGRHSDDFTRAPISFPYIETHSLILPRPLASISMRITHEIRLAQALLKENKRIPLDLVIGHEQGYGITRRLTCKRMQAKWICLVQRTIYDTASSGRCPFNPIDARLLRLGSNYEFAHADGIVTLHDDMTKEIKNHCPLAKTIKAIPNGISVTEDFPHDSRINRKDNVILYAGRLSPEKCVDVLIRSFSRLNRHEIQLRIAGDTPGERDKLEKLAQNLNIERKVVFLGALKHSEVLKEMRKATLFVLPSVSEGLPFVILEAMASGTPVIASNIAGNRAIIGREHGILIPPQDEGRLAEAMMRLMNDDELRHTFSQNGLQRIKKYSWNRLTEIAAEFYETIYVESNHSDCRSKIPSDI